MTITIGLSLALSGEYVEMGRQAEAALQLLVGELNADGGVAIAGQRHELALECRDDASDPARAADIYRWLVGERKVELLLGPYSSRLARVAAPIAEDAGRVFVNHGGASEALHGGDRRMIVSVLSPAGDYLVPFARLLTGLKFWRKRVAIISSRTPFASEVASGFERACREPRSWRRGVRVRLKYRAAGPERVWQRLLPALRRARINALVGVGSFAEDLELMQVLTTIDADIPALACVAAGVTSFGAALGEHAEGIVGPSGWEPEAEIEPALGPKPADFARRMAAAHPGIALDYPAAQAYAAGLLATAALKTAGALDQGRLRAEFSKLRTSTLYGDFAIDPMSGRQVGHQMLLVQWHYGRKVIIKPEADLSQGALEIPSGWRLILAGLQHLRLRGHQGERDEDNEDGQA